MLRVCPPALLVISHRVAARPDGSLPTFRQSPLEVAQDRPLALRQGRGSRHAHLHVAALVRTTIS